MLKPDINKSDQKNGPDDAPIKLVEYGDYECSFCGQAYQIIKDLQSEMGNKLLFVFRNFPLKDNHPHATHAAIAAEAAGAQGKFWKMHDMLYENQNALDDASLVKYAKDCGLDVARFQDDFENGASAEKVESDFESGVRSGVNGTPSFFINGKKYEGNWEEDGLKEYMKELATHRTESR